MNILTADNALVLNREIFESSFAYTSAFDFISRSAAIDTQVNSIINFRFPNLERCFVLSSRNKQSMLEQSAIQRTYFQDIMNEDSNALRAERVKSMIDENRADMNKEVFDIISDGCTTSYKAKYKWYHKLGFRPKFIFKSAGDLHKIIKNSAFNLAAKHNVSPNNSRFYIICSSNVCAELTNIAHFTYTIKHGFVDNKYLEKMGIIAGIDATVYVNYSLPVDDSNIYIYMKPDNRIKSHGGLEFFYDKNRTSIMEKDTLSDSFEGGIALKLACTWGIFQSHENISEFTDMINIKEYKHLTFIQKLFKFLYK